MEPILEPIFGENGLHKKRYNPSTLVFRKGKWYVQVTKPKELQYGSDKQARRSTGTSDKHEARYMQHQLAQEIYENFDKALQRTDPVFELLRPLLEAEGANPKQWYDEGFVEVTVHGAKTRFEKMTGITEVDMGDEKANPVENWKATNLVELLMMVTDLGHVIPAPAIGLLTQEDRTKVLEFANNGPSQLPTDMIIKTAKMLPEELARRLIDFSTKGGVPLIRLSEDVKMSNKATLATALQEYLNSRPDKSRRADKIQLDKWLKHPHFSRLALSEVEQYDAYDFLEEFDEDLTKSSIHVLKAALSSVFNWAKLKRGLSVKTNPFRDLKITSLGKDGIEKRPFKSSELKQLFGLSLSTVDRIAFEILLTTGMRGGELMQVQSISEEDGIKFLDLRELKTKTKGSKRMVPLHDKVASRVSFPLSTNQQRLNRIIRGQFDDVEVTLHSLRHTFKDLARDAGISEEVHKFITGHGKGDVSSNYGHGPSLKTRYDAIMSIPFPWID